MSRQKNHSFKIDDPCPCVSSNRTLRFCCLTVDGHLRKHVPPLDPATPKTNFARAGCYRSSTNDCSPNLTGEHYISKGLLEELAGGIEITGMPWLPVNESRRVGINSLVSNILCERHNSTLHPLDDEAKTFFRFFRDISDDIGNTSLSRKGMNRIVSGELMELWLLKVACGITLSFATANGIRLKDDHIFDLEKVNRAFSQNVWDRGAGMYLCAPQGSSFLSGDSISVAPLTINSEKRVVGIRVWLRGMQFDLVFDTQGLVLPPPNALHRPARLSFVGPRRTHNIQLTWRKDNPGAVVEMTLRAKLKQR